MLLDPSHFQQYLNSSKVYKILTPDRVANINITSLTKILIFKKIKLIGLQSSTLAMNSLNEFTSTQRKIILKNDSKQTECISNFKGNAVLMGGTETVSTMAAERVNYPHEIKYYRL